MFLPFVNAANFFLAVYELLPEPVAYMCTFAPAFTLFMGLLNELRK